MANNPKDMQIYRKKVQEAREAYHKVKIHGDKVDAIEKDPSKYTPKQIKKEITLLTEGLIELNKIQDRAEELAKKVGVKYEPLKR